MALDDLQTIIEKLRDMIETHGDYLSRHETRTRQVLIDPLLRELGWDVSDPEAVQLEYRVGQQWADYALMSDNQPVAVIEAKKLGVGLEDQIMQALNYANAGGIPYMIITNGDTWEMYEVFKQAALEERLLMRLQLSQQAAHKNASQVWAMSKPNLTAKKPGFDPPKSALNESSSKLNEQTKQLSPNYFSEDSDASYSFASIQSYPQRTTPTQLKIGDNVEVEVKSWRDVIHEVTVWLVNEGVLNVSACPILIGNWAFIGREGSVNRNGTPIKDPRELPNGLILQRGNTTTHEQWGRLRQLLNQFNVELHQIEVFYRYLKT